MIEVDIPRTAGIRLQGALNPRVIQLLNPCACSCRMRANFKHFICMIQRNISIKVSWTGGRDKVAGKHEITSDLIHGLTGNHVCTGTRNNERCLSIVPHLQLLVLILNVSPWIIRYHSWLLREIKGYLYSRQILDDANQQRQMAGINLRIILSKIITGRI